MKPQRIKDHTVKSYNENYWYYYGRLTEKIAAYENTSPENIFCSCSIQDIIFRAVLAQKPKKIADPQEIITDEKPLVSMGCTVVRTEDFDNADMIFLSRTDTVTGGELPAESISRTAGLCRENASRLIICETSPYIPDKNVPMPENAAVIGRFPASCAALPFGIGYIRSDDRGFLEKLAKCGTEQSIDISVLAAAAGYDIAFEKRWADNIRRERKYLAESLERLAVKVYPSASDHLAFKAAFPADEMLLRHNILITKLSYRGEILFKTAVTDHGGNTALISALTKEAGSLLPLNFASKYL